MKKFVVLILLVFFQSVYAEEEVYLDLSSQPPKHFDFGQFRYENALKDRDADDDITPSFGNIMRMFKEDMLPEKSTPSDEKNAEQ